MNIINIIEFILPSGIFYIIKKYFTLNFINNFRKIFKYFNIRENSVLLIEFYKVHGETLPGYAKYFIDLGYNVDIILPKQKRNYYLDRNDLELFSCFNNTDKIRIYNLSRINMNFLLRSSMVNNYKYIMINSFADNMIYHDLYKIDLYKLKPICVIHNSNMTNDYLKTNKIISLVNINLINIKSPAVVNSHYFCEIQKHEKNVKTVFTAVNAKNLNRRNIFLLFNACDKLFEKGINNFYIKIIGNGIPIPERYKDNLIDLGYTKFCSMYKEIMDSDFLLALIDQASIQYTNKASGSYQLSYGLLKPIVLHKIFSVVSGFNDDNSILYDDNNKLADSLEKCISMSNNDYLSLVNALEKSEKILYDSSLKNLKKVLESFI